MFDLITIGDTILDTFLVINQAKIQKGASRADDFLCLPFAEKIAIEHAAQSIGGNAANVAVGAQKLGIHSAIVTELGDDINGHVIYDALAHARVHMEYVKQAKGKETRYSVVLNYKSERTILSYHPKRAYTLPRIGKTKWIYYTSLGPGFKTLQRKLIAYLKKHTNVKLAMNPGSYQMKHGLDSIKKIFPHVDVLLVNKEEAGRLVGKRQHISKMFRTLHKKGIETVVITDSIRGSYASDGNDRFFMPAYPIKPVAKTGAGDAYTSGFLAATIAGKSMSDAMQWGTANAGGVVQKFGAQTGLLTRVGITRTLGMYSKVHPKKI